MSLVLMTYAPILRQFGTQGSDFGPRFRQLACQLCHFHFMPGAIVSTLALMTFGILRACSGKVLYLRRDGGELGRQCTRAVVAE
ncbi:hypothetical protein [Nocardia brasiliensis]|uniref:hypothetical protein n=1 Tax=Nocardia brasiliensis TaxID=37326 RepID=UPI0024584AB7|nr:hypothetical protein [Nocardia brasiliensis]